MAHIDSQLARIAHYNMSMRDYDNRSENEFAAMCENARSLADEAISRAPHRKDEIEALYDRYCEKAAWWINEDNRIGAMCPSVMISGPSNFPVRKKERQVSAWKAHHEKYSMFSDMERKFMLIGSGNEPIMSGDSDALERLHSKLSNLERAQDRMKAANAWYRKHKTMEGFEPESARKAAEESIEYQLEHFWFEDEERREHFRLHTLKPFETWKLSNNNAEIRRIKARIAEIEKAKAAEPADDSIVTICGDECRVVENSEAMRLQLFFDGKPSDECRDALKHNGFKWAPSQGAWQRQLNANARFALKRLAS